MTKLSSIFNPSVFSSPMVVVWNELGNLLRLLSCFLPPRLYFLFFCPFVLKKLMRRQHLMFHLMNPFHMFFDPNSSSFSWIVL
ncbi:hypothetical protein GDO81_003376 [Engystomops pustulosus]|uniref:Uncharacterized protein n=1 Tax=Engystomops pustulosus TaxID=76066 RepID=A0AAV6ZW77_ENGPU|nr:hypothetical protein GDO81_003376 [Engystomops pustulosus]